MSRSSGASFSTAFATGSADARRRLPLRPGLGAGARRNHCVRWHRRRSSGTSSRIGLANVKLIAEPGIPAVYTRSARLWATAGPSGTDDSATTSGAFLKGDGGVARAMAFSSEPARTPYAGEERRSGAEHQISSPAMTASLNDLVSFNAKHNGANGGAIATGWTRTWLELRRRRPHRGSGYRAAAQSPVKNFLALTLLDRDADAADGRRGQAHPAGQ